MSEPFSSHSNQQPPCDASGDANGKQEEFVQLLVKYERQLEGFVFALVADWAIAEDVIQETKLRLWSQFNQFDRKQDFGAWARTIAYYQVMTYRKSKLRSHERLFGDEFLQSVMQEESNLQDELFLRKRFLGSCMNKLSDKSRSLLQLVYSSKDTIRQIARNLGRSEAATYTAVQDARLKLRKCIENELRREQLR
jgi:RNA polymerase sigma-70 factor, ECF subfamily